MFAEPSTGKPVLMIVARSITDGIPFLGARLLAKRVFTKGFAIDPFSGGRPVSMISRSAWEQGEGLGSADYWEHGTGPGSRVYWERGDGPGSRAYWENGTGVGSREYWENGTGPGSEEHFKNANKPGTQRYWLSGRGRGSRQYWETGNGPGSHSYSDSLKEAIRVMMRSAIAPATDPGKRTTFSSVEMKSVDKEQSRGRLSFLSRSGKRPDISTTARAPAGGPAPSTMPRGGLSSVFGAARQRIANALEPLKRTVAPRATTPMPARPAIAPLMSKQPSTLRAPARQSVIRDFLRRRSSGQ